MADSLVDQNSRNDDPATNLEAEREEMTQVDTALADSSQPPATHSSTGLRTKGEPGREESTSQAEPEHESEMERIDLDTPVAVPANASEAATPNTNAASLSTADPEKTTTPPPPRESEREQSAAVAAPSTPQQQQQQQPRVSISTMAQSRRSSVASTQSSSNARSISSLNKGSAVFVISALESLHNSKEAKRQAALRDACTRALEMVKSASGAQLKPDAEPLDPRIVFEPLRLACATGSAPLVITSLDCIGKLVSYSFFAEDEGVITSAAAAEARQGKPDPQQQQLLADLVTDTVCDCFSESLDDRAQLQIIKALLATVLSTSVHVHQASLLKAIRTVYNVFLLSKSIPNQAVAQGCLTQMVHHVFGRVKSPQQAQATEQQSAEPEEPQPHLNSVGANVEDAEMEGSSDVPLGGDDSNEGHEGEVEQAKRQSTDEQVTLRTLENRKSFDVDGGVPASERSVPNRGAGVYPGGLSSAASTSALALHPPHGLAAQPASLQRQQPNVTLEELFVKDAFLVTRALCKLSMKPLGTESERDMKSSGMRSKLLSLNLVHTVLKSHMRLFTDPKIRIYSASTGELTPFVGAVKQYLCLSLTRNGVSSIAPVFEVSCEIFWLVLSGMRTKMKKEIELLLNEIFLPILEMRNATSKQKSSLLNVFTRLCQDPQALVEIYINYDCDRAALENIYERLMNVISRISQSHVAPGSTTAAGADESSGQKSESGQSGTSDSVSSDSISAASLTPDARLKRQSLECLCSVLRSLNVWSGRGSSTNDTTGGLSRSNGNGTSDATRSPRASEDIRGESILSPATSMPDGVSINSPMLASPEISRGATPEPNSFGTALPPSDDPTRFENAKLRKTTLLEGIRKFNKKPKIGLAFLIEHGFIRGEGKDPREIARFLLSYGSAADGGGLNKAQIGEYLGEGEQANITIMHAFVDLMHFENMGFTDALRRFLQAFRLPGEAQKIDRFMLKFAERYVQGNPTAFANADAAYVFAFSVIMLNTDAHNPQIKHRMTLQDFLKNNRGINDGESLPEEYVTGVYEEIQRNEIKMKDEQPSPAAAVAAGAGTGLAGAIATVGRDLQREAYVLQSEGMANKTDALFRTMVRAQRRVHPQQRAAAEQFFSASHFQHVRPMFEIAWMPFLAGISGPMQESDDPDTIDLCLEGFRDAIHIVCLFGLELERNAFVTTLAKFTFLNNLGEMKSKNVQAIKALLGVAMSEGNSLKGSWKEVLTCVSQLERFQLISDGVDERQLPAIGRRQSASNSKVPLRSALPTNDVVQAGASSDVTVAADMVFSSTPHLSGTAIVDFVRALSDVSSDEIQSTGMTVNPRLFSLQKLVEISYYNMKRIRMEWSNIWAVLGEHFNVVVCSPNPAVSSFAIDALRQLANRFLELEELPHFKFQKDFLKPFDFAMRNNRSSDAQEMVLQCISQMMASRIQNMRSGFRTLLSVLGAASRSQSDRVVMFGFELAQRLSSDHFGQIILQGTFVDICVCLTEFTKNPTQRVALQAISALRALVPSMLNAAECPIHPDADPGPAALTPLADDPMVRFWFPALFAFYDVIMNGDDLEVRRVALDSLFEILKKYGSTFRPDFWDTVCQEVLFPMFAVLRSRSDVSRFSTQEDMSVWLSTTMIQALRNLIDLWTHYFETLERLLPGLLDLLCACVCQENDTLARIGTSCLQQLLEKNVRKLTTERWTQVVDALVQLFRTTTAHQLFDPALRSDSLPGGPGSPNSAHPDSPTVQFAPAPLSGDQGSEGSDAAQPPPSLPMTQAERRRAFKQIIVKCVLQLLLIETTHELLQNSDFYATIPAVELLRLTTALEDSYRFSKRFNADRDLRMALWKVGFMKQLPNLLKQESSSAATLVHVLVCMHADRRSGHRAMRQEVRRTLIPLGEDIVEAYLPLDPETQSRNIVAWTPVVAEVFLGICTFEDGRHGADDSSYDDEPLATIARGGINGTSEAEMDEIDEGERYGEGSHGSVRMGAFSRYAQTFYPMAVELLGRPTLPTEITSALRRFFGQVGRAEGLIDPAREQARLARRAESIRLEREREQLATRKAEEQLRLSQEKAQRRKSTLDAPGTPRADQRSLPRLPSVPSDEATTDSMLDGPSSPKLPRVVIEPPHGDTEEQAAYDSSSQDLISPTNAPTPPTVAATGSDAEPLSRIVSGADPKEEGEGDDGEEVRMGTTAAEEGTQAAGARSDLDTDGRL